jgi:hypothetical protein
MLKIPALLLLLVSLMSYAPANPGSYDSDLGSNEYFWVDHQPFLLSRGYQLRPRYDPTWVPTWKQVNPKETNPKKIIPFFYEDGCGLLVGAAASLCYVRDLTHAAQKGDILDATQIKDGVKVVLKRVPSAGNEVEIALYLSSAEMRSNPRNRTVPILDVITLPDDKYVLLVMPYLRIFNTPPFHCRMEFVEAIRQFLQVCLPGYSLRR